MLENGDFVAESDTAQGIYEEYCDWEGVGYGDANYKVYLNLKNPLVVDAKGKNWNNISREYSQEIADRYNSLTAEEKAALTNLAEWGEYSIFRDEMLDARAAAEQGVSSGFGDAAFTKTLARAYEKLGGANANLYDAFSIASDNFSEESIKQFAVKQMNTRDYAKKAKAEGYDGVIFKNIHDNGGYSNGSEGASTVAIAFESNQIKSVANEKPSGDADIRYSLSDSKGRELSAEQQEYFKDSKVVDANGNLKVMYHGTPSGKFTVFKDGTYFTENKWYADLYQNPGASSISTGKVANAPKTYEVYLDIKKPFDINDAEARKIYINDYIKGGNAVGINPYLSDAEYSKIGSIDWTEGEDLRGFLIENGYDYDGLVLNEGAVGGYGEDVKSRGKSYVIFTPEQVKNVDNKTPTSDPDIRYSLSDGEKSIDKYSQKQYNDFGWARVNEAISKNELDDMYSKIHEKGSLKKFPQTSSGEAIIEVNNEPNTTLGVDNVFVFVTGTKNNPQISRVARFQAETETEMEIIKGKLYERGSFSNTYYSFLGQYGFAREYSKKGSLDYLGYQETIRRRSRGAESNGIDENSRFVQNGSGTLAETQSNEIAPIKASSTDGVFFDATKNSLSPIGETPKKYGNYNVYGKDLMLETPADIAPVRETVTKTETVEDIAPVQEVNSVTLREELKELEDYIRTNYNNREVFPNEDGLAEVLNTRTELEKKIAQAEAEEKAMNRDRLNSLTDEDVPPETDIFYPELHDFAEEDYERLSNKETYSETLKNLPDDPFADRNIEDVGKRNIKAYQYENPEVKPFFQQEAEVMLRELREGLKGQRYTLNDDAFHPTWTGQSRVTSDEIAYLLDVCNYTYDQIEKGLNAIIKDDGAENNACSKRIEFMLNDRLMKGYNDMWDGSYNPPDQGYIDLLREKEINAYNEEAYKHFFENADDYAPPVDDDISPIATPANNTAVQTEDIAPVAKPKPETNNKTVGADNVNGEQPTAKILTTEPEIAKKKQSGFAKFRASFLDKGSVFEDLSLKTKNRELMGKWNHTLSSESRAQWLIGKGTRGVKALNDIRAEVENSGLAKQFYEYVYHKHNVDRMNLESKAAATIEALKPKFGHLKIEQVKAIAAQDITERTTEKTAATILEAKKYLNAMEAKNKAVFGYNVTSEVSQEIVGQYESANPEFKRYAQDVYDYMNHLRRQMVKNGLISQETAKLWAEMYPHYVPIRRVGDAGLNINVPLDTGRTGVNAPIKRATGGNRDILPLFDTMAMRTEQTFKAIAKNSFGVELKNTLGTTIESAGTNLDEIIDSIDVQDGLLQEGKDGRNPTFTVFENGEKVTFEITEEMYDALKPTSKGLSYTNKVANTVGNIHRGLLTEYNPTFAFTNAIKDAQDVLINSQHPVKTYANLPKAYMELAKKGRWFTEYMENGGEQNTYFDGKTNTFTAEDKGFKKIIGMPLRAMSAINNFIERAPRLAEYITSRQSGASVEVAMLDAARVTTNFAAGGDVTKFLNRNGATFLNASVQGFNQQVRNIREAKANGLKGWVGLATKFALAGLPALLLNNLMWDDDEEYEALSDYVKDNYYVVAKYGDGKFVRIPKGRALAVIQDAFEQAQNVITGDADVDFANFAKLAISNLAPNNPIDNNILAPIIQVANNETWYGDDLVPTRLQDLPKAEQFDESTDAISKWLGEKQDFLSPYQINYLFNQYSGGVGDVLLPMLTPEAESGDNSLLGNFIAPLKDKFTTDSVMNNQNVSDFYNTVDELTTNAKASGATDEDVLKYKYINSINADLGELYAQKREIQNSNLSDEAKYAAVRRIQEQIDSLAKDSLNTYNNVKIDGNYAKIGDLHYRMNNGEWQKITDDQLEKQEKVTKGLGISASVYWDNKSEYDFAYEYPEKYDFFNSIGLSYKTYKDLDEDGKRAYSWAYENPDKFTVSKAVANDVVTYRQYSSELYDIKADKDENGKSISGSRKEKVIEYVNNLDIDYGAKLILFKSEYNADDTYNYEIIDYLNGREDISYDEMETILKELGFTVHQDGTIEWD